jgi:hypothetical protein
MLCARLKLDHMSLTTLKKNSKWIKDFSIS